MTDDSVRGRLRIEGLNSVKYNVEEIKEEPLYTIIRVEIEQKDYTYPKCEEKAHRYPYKNGHEREWNMKCWYPQETHP